MGVDICLFAKNNKKYVSLDRKYVLQSYWDLYNSPEMSNEDVDELHSIYAKLADDIDRSVNFREIEKLTLANLKSTRHPRSDSDLGHLQYCEGWNRIILAFVNKYPDDEFFVVADNESPDCYEYMKQYGDGTHYVSGELDPAEQFQYDEIKVEDLIKE
ncbi:MAG TPA: hypothetical protein VI911_11495 [Patescibacteria group bacterium]|nr:hypothetical protein [Patescibacteria group bacterium]